MLVAHRSNLAPLAINDAQNRARHCGPQATVAEMRRQISVAQAIKRPKHASRSVPRASA